MAGGESAAVAAEAPTLEYTPTWIVSAVCTVIVCISIFFERGLHRLGKYLKHKDQKPLFEALQKVKEELMLLGFISLLLTVFQGSVIQKICIPESLTHHMLPCSLDEKLSSETTAHFTVTHIDTNFASGPRRRLAGGGAGNTYCMNKGKVPLLSLEAIHELHIFIFVLAITHIVCSLVIVILGGIQIHGWKQWEDEIQKSGASNATPMIRHVQQFEFIQSHFKGFGKDSFILSWMHSFLKQFYGSVSKSDYTTMRLGFIMTHCKSNPKFNFHKYMIRALEADFKKVVGISWYLWAFVMIFLLLNVHGWHTYFWILFLPLLLLLALGTKLEHIITQLAHEVAERHSAVEGELLVTPSDDLFWFHRPRLVLHLIHFILFQNAFEIAYFFWILATYGFNSCIMDKVGYIVTRLAVSVVVQVLCSYCILPLYAIVTQMGSTFKKAIFDEHVQEGLVDWAQKIKRRGKRTVKGQVMSDAAELTENPARIEMQNVPAQVEEEITADRPILASAAPSLHPSGQH